MNESNAKIVRVPTTDEGFIEVKVGPGENAFLVAYQLWNNARLKAIAREPLSQTEKYLLRHGEPTIVPRPVDRFL